MENKRKFFKKWYKNPILWAIVLMPFIIIITLFIVTRPALFNWFILDSESGYIGNAIGGVGTVIVGILNVIMLYLTFKRQSDSLDIEKEKLKREKEDRKSEKEYNRYRNLCEQLGEMKKSWLSKKMTLYDGKEYSINNSIKSLEALDISDYETICEEIFLFFSQLYNILELSSEIGEEYKNQLYKEAGDFYENIMKHKYDKTINLPTSEIKDKLSEINHDIDRKLYE